MNKQSFSTQTCSFKEDTILVVIDHPSINLIYFYLFFYLLFISHWPLLFYNNIAIHCKMLYANLSQQLHTIKTN